MPKSHPLNIMLNRKINQVLSNRDIARSHFRIHLTIITTQVHLQKEKLVKCLYKNTLLLEKLWLPLCWRKIVTKIQNNSYFLFWALNKMDYLEL